MSRAEAASPTIPTAPASTGPGVEALLQALVDDGVIEATEAPRVVATARTRAGLRQHPLAVIADQRVADRRNAATTLTLEQLTVWLAERSGLPYHRIDPLRIDVAAVTSVVSYAYAARRRILAVSVSPERIVFATADPWDEEWIGELSRLLRRRIERVLANPRDIARYLDEFYSLSRSVSRASQAASGAPPDIIRSLEQLVELGRAGKLDAEDQHIVHIVDWLLQYAFEQRASDIHLEPRREQGNIRFRIDGVLHLVYHVPPPVLAAIVNRIKTLGRMDVAEKRRPQDGRLKIRTPQGTEVELRLSTVSTAQGEKLVLRIFDPAVLRRNFRQLGLTDAEYGQWERMTRQPNGIILVTGPTGSGKTTTLYSTLKQLATEEVNVCTVEDPIEMIEPDFNQMQAQPAIGLSFAAGIRSLLRQDPDIIMVGEVRDRETAEMAVQAALTGHLVLTTLHTNDAPSAITRLREIGVPAYLINATVTGVVAQRLVRTLCPHCKQPAALDDSAWHTLVRPWRFSAPQQVYQPAGCLECRNTGYLGRIGLYEILTVSDELRALVSADADIVQVREQALRDGMQLLRISGARKVSAGITTVEEVMRVIPKEGLG